VVGGGEKAGHIAQEEEKGKFTSGNDRSVGRTGVRQARGEKG